MLTATHVWNMLKFLTEEKLSLGTLANSVPNDANVQIQQLHHLYNHPLPGLLINLASLLSTSQNGSQNCWCEYIDKSRRG